MRRARHLKPQRRLDRWIDNVAILVGLSSIILWQIHPRIAWWLLLALCAGRLGFSALYRWKERRAQAEWKTSMDGSDSV